MDKFDGCTDIYGLLGIFPATDIVGKDTHGRPYPLPVIPKNVLAHLSELGILRIGSVAHNRLYFIEVDRNAVMPGICHRLSMDGPYLKILIVPEDQKHDCVRFWHSASERIGYNGDNMSIPITLYPITQCHCNLLMPCICAPILRRYKGEWNRWYSCSRPIPAPSLQDSASERIRRIVFIPMGPMTRTCGSDGLKMGKGDFSPNAPA